MWSLLKDTAANWSKHKAAQLGAALAYYSIFSLGPLLVIAVAVAGFTFEQEAVRGEVSAELRALLGDTGAQAVNAMLLGASQPREGILATVFGVGTLVLAALGLVVQLKDALNTVWEVEPPRRSGIWDFVRTYIVSLAAVLSLGFLLLVSLLLTAALAAGGRYFAPYVPEVAMHALGSNGCQTPMSLGAMSGSAPQLRPRSSRSASCSSASTSANKPSNRPMARQLPSSFC